jgi:septum formation protein
MLQNGLQRLVLASASSSRRSLLNVAGLQFDVSAASLDESEVKSRIHQQGGSGADVALLLAENKARRVAEADPDALVIGADQVLVCGGAWFDKPQSLQEARCQLLALRGRTHVLETAVACVRGSACVWRHLSQPVLTMREFSMAFLDAYLATEGEKVLGSVGAYRLEAAGVHLFERVDGEHSAILGLPLLPLLAFLRGQGVLAS